METTSSSSSKDHPPLTPPTTSTPFMFSSTSSPSPSSAASPPSLPPATTPPSPLDSSPELLASLILPHLDVRSAIRFMACCRSFLEAAAAPLVWLPICHRALPRPFPSPACCLEIGSDLQALLCLTLSGIDVRQDPLPTWQHLKDLACALTRMPPLLRPTYQHWGWFLTSLTVNTQEHSCSVGQGTPLHIQASGHVFNNHLHTSIHQLLCGLESSPSPPPHLAAPPPPRHQHQHEQHGDDEQQHEQQQQQFLLHKLCFYNGNPSRPTPFTASFDMPAPREAGAYMLCFKNDLQYTTQDALRNYGGPLGERHAAFFVMVE